MKIVYMGTPDFAVPPLEALVRSGYEVAAVVTQPDKPKGRGKTLMPTPVKEEAMKYDIPVYQPLKVRDPEFVEILENIAPDIIVVAAFGQIIPKKILDMPKYGCINIPWYPQGPNTINDYFTDIFFWRQAGNKQSNILVFESLRTLLQDNFESTWASSIQVGYTYFADDGAWMIEDTPWGPSIMSDNEYSFDTSLLGKLPNGGTGSVSYTHLRAHET